MTETTLADGRDAFEDAMHDAGWTHQMSLLAVSRKTSEVEHLFDYWIHEGGARVEGDIALDYWERWKTTPPPF